jgi:DNA glycosylase AlkZ-like
VSDALATRQLNRTLLGRQLLLERAGHSPLQVVDRLVGLQAQEPQAPYQGLWARIAGFDPDSLSRLLAERAVVRTWLMRTTIHLVSRTDCLDLALLMLTGHERRYGSTASAKAAASVDRTELLSAAADLLAEEPRTRSELGVELAKRWPDVEGSALAYTAAYLLPLVQVPPRGLWRTSGAVRMTTIRQWLGETPTPSPNLHQLVRRYLYAFGPATAADFRAWSGLANLGDLFASVDGLRTFSDEQGRTLYDAADGLLVDADVEAPVRFLPPFDNAILGHHDRSRIVPQEFRALIAGGDRLMRVFLVDGFVAGNWTIANDTLLVQPFRRLDAGESKGVRAEAEQLLDFLSPGTKKRMLRIGDQ